MIESAYRLAEAYGIPLWCQGEAGPYQAIPHPGAGWFPWGDPGRQPHEYVRGGTAKLLTLFRPATGEVRATGVTQAPNAVLHPWLQAELTAILHTLPEASPPVEAAPFIPDWWQRRPQGAGGDDDPPLQLILIWDNLAGHKSVAMVRWLCAHGILPLYTPLSGSWLNLPRGHPQSHCNGLLSAARWRGSIPRRPQRSSAGWRRRWRGGTRSRRRSCGRANAGNGGTARGTDCWAVRRQQPNLSYLRHDPLVLVSQARLQS